MKKIFLLLFIFITLVFNNENVCASANIKARIGDNFYDTLEEAINASSSTDIISLTGDVILDKTLEIKKTVNINLNNRTISTEEQVFLVKGGSLNLSGNGKIVETKPNYGAIMIIGSDDPSKKDYSTVSVGNGVTLEGWSGIFITHDNNKSYGVLVNMNGDINAVDDVSGGPGAGIYVNGKIKDDENSPIINLSNTVNITSTGNGIYAAGYATYNINGAYISGDESGLGIKSGVFNIIDGTIVGTGLDKTPTSGNNNGINASGTAIQIESNSGYKGDIELYIKDGDIKSKNSNVIYEYTVKNSQTKVKNIDITGGTYISDVKKEVFSLSDSFKSNHSSFISGGTYSSNPSDYLESGYSTSLNENSLYEVVRSTISVFGLKNEKRNNSIPIFPIIGIIVVLGIITYLNRKKILNLISKYIVI